MASTFDKADKAYAALIKQGEDSHLFIQEKVITIGRSDCSSILVPNSALISRKHCVIQMTEENKFTICDMSSRGTFVNNQQLIKNKPQELHHRDEIILVNAATASFLFLINKSLLSKNDTQVLNSRMKKKLETLDSSHTEEMQKMNDEIVQINVRKSGMKEEMIAHQKRFEQHEQRLLKLDVSTPEQAEEKRKQLQEMENKRKINEEMVQDMLRKIEEITKKEEMLQKSREEMEERHIKERSEIEARFQSEISELKEKLTLFEIEQERLLSENREVERQLQETRLTLIDCELEQGRIFDEKAEVETRLESTVKQVIDLTKESDHKVETLEKEFQSKDEEKDKILKSYSEEIEKYKKTAENVEDSLMCSVCAEIFIEPMFIDCSHVFCKTCIDEWQKKKKICPLCRSKFKTAKRTFHLDGVIDAFVTCMSPDARERRETIVKERIQGPSNVPVKKRKHSQRALNTVNAIEAVVQGVGGSIEDPFTWTNRNRRRHTAVETITQSSVSVAAIDLTSVDTPLRPRFIDPDTTIDLTTL